MALSQENLKVAGSSPAFGSRNYSSIESSRPSFFSPLLPIFFFRFSFLENVVRIQSSTQAHWKIRGVQKPGVDKRTVELARNITPVATVVPYPILAKSMFPAGYYPSASIAGSTTSIAATEHVALTAPEQLR